VNWLSPLKERVTIVTGERGALVADTLTADLALFENAAVPEPGRTVGFFGMVEGNMTRFAFAKPEPLRVEHEQFRDALLGRPADIVTLKQGAATIAVANAVARAAATGTSVEVRAA
jgi:predicted dehydrogenase